ncbi:uncharacterized protein CLUP02_14741 [Colletotrichum lupini]|uniref:Uncharacterized protein n=1 Tax=Colletotrichum lupini TaxID=145971 RepID=A0A9Q8WML9_9PEZI|nr:uncharacterized protein CLUP02_14741 [Colletotrichum lupini]UQC89213.1 hypothetical protein CLUP02_14741 [Colletotrichum lupini]
MAEPSYSRNELVSELTSYHEFLTRLFLPPEVVQHPPEGGWEHITPDFIKSLCLGKNDTVADLMRHIPYVSRTKEDHWDPWMVYEGATAVGFTGDVVLSLPTSTPTSGSSSLTKAISRPHPFRPMCLFTRPYRPAATVILSSSTRSAARSFLRIPRLVRSRPGYRILKHRTEKPGADFKPTQFTSFFAMAKENIKKFEMTAMNRRQIYDTTRDTPHAQIHREEGVFTKRYDRERCMNRLDEYQEQKDRANRQNRGEEEPASVSAERHIHDVSVSSGAVS